MEGPGQDADRAGNHQVGASLTGRVLFLTDPLPGGTHDARAFRGATLADALDTSNSIADKGYLGTGMLTPFRRPPGRELSPWQKEFNATVNSLGVVVEQPSRT